MSLSDLSERTGQSLEAASERVAVMCFSPWWRRWYEGINHNIYGILCYEVLYIVYGISVSVTHLILWLPHAKGKAGIIPCSAGGKLDFSC